MKKDKPASQVYNIGESNYFCSRHTVLWWEKIPKDRCKREVRRSGGLYDQKTYILHTAAFEHFEKKYKNGKLKTYSKVPKNNIFEGLGMACIHLEILEMSCRTSLLKLSYHG